MAEVPPKSAKTRLTIEALAEELAMRGIAVKYNLINCEYEIMGRTDAGFTMSQDDLLARMHNALTDLYKGATFETLAAYINFIAREHRYNPVLEALEAVTWDGVDRLPQLYALMGLEADSLSQALVRKWLMQSVALLFNDAADPFGADGCLVLNGAQGAGKTSLFRHLALRDAWFGEGLTVNDRDKDTTRRIVTTWIAELGEVESTLKSDISALKAFVSASIDHYRLPYGRADVVAPRMTSLCATCNSDRYLIDPTGNRRWWSVPFSRMIPRAELVALDALQRWAQIFAEVAPCPITTRQLATD
jgi:putative DNA primase/helicase